MCYHYRGYYDEIGEQVDRRVNRERKGKEGKEESEINYYIVIL